MFERASTKLEDGRALLSSLTTAQDAHKFRAFFNGLVNTLRGVTNALQSEGKRIEGFQEWYATKQDEMRSDQLLRFIHDARLEDFHTGKHRLRFPEARIESFTMGAAGPPPTADATVAIGPAGPVWVIDKGTPTEKRFPVTAGGSWSVDVRLDNAPHTHLGETMARNDPVAICEDALTYLENLVYEAKATLALPL